MTYDKRCNISSRLITLVMTLMLPMVIYAKGIHFDNVFDFDHVLSYLVGGFLIGIFLLLFYNRLYIYREQEINKQQHKQNIRLSTIMQTGRMQMWIYDTESQHYRFISEDGTGIKEYNPIDFVKFFNRDDFEELRSSIFEICENKRITSIVNLRSQEEDEEYRKYYEIHLSIAEKDSKGQIKHILGVQRDITNEQEKKNNTNKLMMRYSTVFNSSLVDMFYYDKDGLLTDLNDTACTSLQILDKKALIREKHYFKENILLNSIDFKMADHIHMSTIIDIEEYDKTRFWVEQSNRKGKIYYEEIINTVLNDKGEFKGVYVAGRNISEMVNSFHKQQKGAQDLKKAIKHIQEYIDNINYALRISNVRLVDYHPSTYTFTISNTVDKTQMKFSQLRCIRLAMPQYRRIVSSALNRMDHLTSHPIEQTIETEIRDEKKRQMAFMFNLVPILNNDSKVEHYFGLCRNMTDMLETERLLAVETQKAQEAEMLKESFLTNMSYEIRTPLNSVLGFASLFEMEHDEADETVFVEEIKRNTNILLRLINDILFLSRIDADMVEFKHEDFDFAEVFESYCQMGWAKLNPEVKVSISTPYEHLIINGDIEHLGKAIQMICTRSAHYTHQGFVRAKYEYLRGELVIVIEDSGDGIDPDLLPKIFNRFVRDKDERLSGTGLDMPIIEALVKKMGGSIEISSELGKGSTIGIFLPCQAIEIKKKINIDNNTEPVIA